LTSARIPDGAWTWRGTTVVLGVVLVPVLALSLFVAGGDLLLAAARFDGLILSPAALVSAIACYAAWRINPRPGLAWATIGLALLGSQEFMRAAVQLIGFPEPVPAAWVLAADVTWGLVFVVAVTIAHSVQRRPDPAGTGFALGAAVGALSLTWFERGPDLGDKLPQLLVCIVYVVVLLAGAGLLLWGGGLTPRIGSIPGWARQRTVLAIVLIGGAHLTDYVGDGTAAHAMVVVGDTAGAALLVSTYLAHFVLEVDEADLIRSNLNNELLQARHLIRAHRARFHEINSTIAGITSASGLLRSADGISEQRRIVLADMISAELGRLERLMASSSHDAEPVMTDLDETIGTLVVSQEARGNQVRWSPACLHALAQPDAVAEVINVLLDNAAKHGRSPAQITMTPTGDTVEIAVHDDGPGLSESLRARLFSWGARGPHSTGQGIGLHIARELAEQQGGYLEIRDSGLGGATFVLGLRYVRAEHLESLEAMTTANQSDLPPGSGSGS
jgi:signal transduction histidine kinase